MKHTNIPILTLVWTEFTDWIIMACLFSYFYQLKAKTIAVHGNAFLYSIWSYIQIPSVVTYYYTIKVHFNAETVACGTLFGSGGKQDSFRSGESKSNGIIFLMFWSGYMYLLCIL